MEAKFYTPEERTEALERAARDILRDDPNIDRFQLARLLIEASERFLPLAPKEEQREGQT